jgi:membrane protein DedA with SNARE-associated domain
MSEYLMLGWLGYALWAVIVVLGGAIAVYAFRASRSAHSRSLLLLGVGFLLISVAAGVLWIGLYWAATDPMTADIGACTAMVAGFAVVLASVWVRAS